MVPPWKRGWAVRSVGGAHPYPTCLDKRRQPTRSSMLEGQVLDKIEDPAGRRAPHIVVLDLSGRRYAAGAHRRAHSGRDLLPLVVDQVDRVGCGYLFRWDPKVFRP